MRVIEDLIDGYEVYDALASYTRLEILKVLLKNNEMNLDEISKSLHIAKGSLTMHIKKLEAAGLISVRLSLARRGTQKLCRINEEKLIINIIPQKKELNSFETELNVGQYAGVCGGTDLWPLYHRKTDRSHGRSALFLLSRTF